jgi:hypothetical protein
MENQEYNPLDVASETVQFNDPRLAYVEEIRFYKSYYHNAAQIGLMFGRLQNGQAVQIWDPLTMDRDTFSWDKREVVVIGLLHERMIEMGLNPIDDADLLNSGIRFTQRS